MSRLVWTSLMSEVAEPFCKALADYLTQHADIDIHFTANEPFPHRRQMVMDEAIDMAWICGVDYVTDMGRADWSIGTADWPFEPLVSVCHDGDETPLYYSDMIVRADSPFQSFADLRGSMWAYNEVESFSGYKIMQGYLAEMGEAGPFFSRKVKSGSHINSVAMIAQGKADSAVIDSSVMQAMQRTEPKLLSKLRIITRIGPYPMLPLVTSKKCPPSLRGQLEIALTTMHQSKGGSELLKRFQINHFAAVDDKYYDPIRACLRQSAHVVL